MADGFLHYTQTLRHDMNLLHSPGLSCHPPSFYPCYCDVTLFIISNLTPPTRSLLWSSVFLTLIFFGQTYCNALCLSRKINEITGKVCVCVGTVLVSCSDAGDKPADWKLFLKLKDCCKQARAVDAQ